MNPLFSVRMRASKNSSKNNLENKTHVSGAERIAPENKIHENINNFITRALNHPNGPVDDINLTIQKLKKATIRTISALPIITSRVNSDSIGINLAKNILSELQIPIKLIEISFNWIKNGPIAGGGNMRGAILLDITTGNRLEKNKCRGIRAKHLDFTPTIRDQLKKQLQSNGTYGERTPDALAIASKICHFPGVIAELCCSDDPDYVGGYVASKKLGYVRINKLKPDNHPFGGRVIFFDPRKTTSDCLIKFIEHDPVLINQLQCFSAPLTYNETLNFLEIQHAN